MANVENMNVKVSDEQGRSLFATLQIKTWTKAEAKLKAMQWGGALLLVGIVMIPIPLIHFLAIPVVLIGMPVVSVSVYKLYANGTDVSGDTECPACRHKLLLTTNGDRWPMHGVCLSCREPYSVDRA